MPHSVCVCIVKYNTFSFNEKLSLIILKNTDPYLCPSTLVLFSLSMWDRR